MRNADAQAALYGEQERGYRIKNDALGSAPDVLRTAISATAGSDGATFDRWLEANRTGKMPTTSATGDAATDAAIGINPQPAIAPDLAARFAQAYQRMAPAFFNPGAVKVDDWAQAAGAYQRQDALDGMLTGRISPATGGQAFAALEAKPLVNAIGSTGRVVNNFTGAGSVSNPDLAAGYDQGQQAIVAQRQAAASASRALANRREAPPAPAGGAMPAPAGPSGAADPMDRAALSEQLGVPVAPADPFRGMSAKGTEAMRKSVYDKADKRVAELEEAARADAGLASDVRRFVELQASTGGLQQGPLVGRIPGLSDAAQEMDAITDRLTPKMREPGSGATSDFDAKMFRNATVSRTKNDAVNAAIATGVEARSKMAADRAQYMRDYLTVNGHLDGAERLWSQYANANPIFDPRSPQVPKLNEARVSYQDFFRSGGAASPAPAPAPDAPAAAGGARPFRLSANEAEANVQFRNLPSGAEFIAPDGTRRRKP